jgi:hypothetical protein
MRRIIRETFAVFIGLGALVYLLAPSLVPDFLPFIGWIDEGMATTVLLSVLSYYGIDLTHLLGRSPHDDDKQPGMTAPQSANRKRFVRVPRAEYERGNLTRDDLQKYEIVELDDTRTQPQRTDR